MARLTRPARHHRAIDGLEITRRRGSETQAQLAERVRVILGRATFDRMNITQLEGPGEDDDYWHDAPTKIVNAIEDALSGG